MRPQALVHDTEPQPCSCRVNHSLVHVYGARPAIPSSPRHRVTPYLTTSPREWHNNALLSGAGTQYGWRTGVREWCTFPFAI